MRQPKLTVGPVGFPRNILDALREGKLVIFAGAGVSMNHPANLPNFEDLATEVAGRIGWARRKGEGPVDYFTRIDTGDGRVHLEVADALTQNNPKPNSLHEDILRLFARQESPKIVTTNFDMLFEEAQPSRGFLTYSAPALPPGDRFQGIVHLHGNTYRPQEMVITLRDISRAYLMEGWALNFLKQMFSSHTVLFVGYSHDDVMMQFLARGMPSLSEEEQNRYALIREGEAAGEGWASWGITLVEFPEDPGDRYANLPIAIGKLAEFVTRGRAERKQRIQEIAERPLAPTDPEEHDQIVEALHDPGEELRFFTEVAQNPYWLEWVEQNFNTKRLFQPGELSPAECNLAEWMAVKFAVHHPEALKMLIGRHCSNLNPVLWEQIAYVLHDQERTGAAQQPARQWISLLLNKIPRPSTERTRRGLEYIAEICLRDSLTESMVTCFGEMCRTELRVLDGRIELATACPQWLLNKTWSTMRVNMINFSGPVLDQATRRLRERYIYAAQWSSGSEANELESKTRQDIGIAPDGLAVPGVNAIIDAARECLEWLASSDPEEALQWCHRNLYSEVALLKRLAVYTMGLLPEESLSVDERLSLIVDGEMIYDQYAYEEVVAVAESAYPYASDSVWQRLLAQLQGPTTKT